MKTRAHWLQLLLVALICLSPALACGGQASKAAGDYHAQMLPLLLKNQQLAQEFLGMSTRVRTNQLTVEETIQIWQNRIIPLADGLSTEATAIQPGEPVLDTHHERLVKAWKDRADAYRAMLKAYRDHDPAAFSNARTNNFDAKLIEEQYFEQVNTTMRDFGYILDQFPG